MESSFFEQSSDTLEHAEPLQLASGSTCTVSIVRIDGKRLLVKRLKPEYKDNPRYRELFHKEYELGSSLDHVGLVKYVSINEDQEGMYILMHYFDGDTLEERMSKQPEYFLLQDNVRNLFAELLSCLSYLHSHQILHLDLKPDNILISKISNNVKIIDLGFCYSDVYDNTRGHNRFYSAPEQKEAGGKPDVRTDIYAVGKLLETVSSISPKLKKSKGIQRIIAKSTATRRDLRYSSAQQMKEELLATFSPGNTTLKALSVIVVLIATCTFVYFAVFHHTVKTFEIENCAVVQVISEDSQTCKVIDYQYHPDYKNPSNYMINSPTVFEGKEYKIVSLAKELFAGDSMIHTLCISEGVQIIEPLVCYECENLETVSLPTSVTSIGHDCFAHCHNLRNIILPANISALEHATFVGCQSLENIHLSEGITRIGFDCFVSCGLRNVSLPSTLQVLERGVFFDCTHLQSITLPQGLQRIGEYCFYQCDSLTEVVNLNPVPIPIADVFNHQDTIPRTLYVPSESIDLYRKAIGWKDFQNILPLEEE